MIAFLKAWIILIIIFQNHIFMKYIDYSCENYKSIRNTKLFLTIYSITLLYLAVKAETTYQTIFRFGTLLLLSPIIFLLNLIEETSF
jgi:hypothetical protein